MKLIKIDEIGCKTETGGTALLSLRYHVSINVGSLPVAANSSLINCNSDDNTYVGIGR